jgi:hypothetical protein
VVRHPYCNPFIYPKLRRTLFLWYEGLVEVFPVISVAAGLVVTDVVEINSTYTDVGGFGGGVVARTLALCPLPREESICRTVLDLVVKPGRHAGSITLTAMPAITRSEGYVYRMNISTWKLSDIIVKAHVSFRFEITTRFIYCLQYFCNLSEFPISAA